MTRRARPAAAAMKLPEPCPVCGQLVTYRGVLSGDPAGLYETTARGWEKHTPGRCRAHQAASGKGSR